MKEILSEPFPLSPGIFFEGKQHADAQVRLLTRGDRRKIEQADEAERADLLFKKSISRIGSITDPNKIATATDLLTGPDEIRIASAIAKLEAKMLVDSEPEPPLAKRKLLPTDICSEPFALNPGIVVEGQEVKTAVVRLLRRGEVRLIEQEMDEDKRDTLSLLFTIVQLGNLTDLKPEHIDLLVGVDIERINARLRGLQEQYAPDPKSQCAYCGRAYTDRETGE